MCFFAPLFSLCVWMSCICFCLCPYIYTDLLFNITETIVYVYNFSLCTLKNLFYLKHFSGSLKILHWRSLSREFTWLGGIGAQDGMEWNGMVETGGWKLLWEFCKKTWGLEWMVAVRMVRMQRSTLAGDVSAVSFPALGNWMDGPEGVSWS